VMVLSSAGEVELEIWRDDKRHRLQARPKPRVQAA
jgi:hypothetical protein